MEALISASTLRFVIASTLAAMSCGVSLLAPRVVRNEQFRQICLQEQIRLVELESRNHQRIAILQKLDRDPELFRELSDATSIRLAESIPLADSSLTPADRFRFADGAPLPLDPLSTVQDQSAGLGSGRSGREILWQGIERVATDPDWQYRLNLFAGLLLLIGLLPGSAAQYRRSFRPVHRQLLRWASRYRLDRADHSLAGPHLRTDSQSQSHKGPVVAVNRDSASLPGDKSVPRAARD